SRLYPVRALHRRLRRRDGEDRPPAAADRLRHRSQHQASAAGQDNVFKIVRVRTALYVANIALVGGVMLYTLATRTSEGLSVLHVRNPIFVRLSDGALRNGYTVRVLNKTLETRRFMLAADGLADAFLEVAGDTTSPVGYPIVEVGPDQTREVR